MTNPPPDLLTIVVNPDGRPRLLDAISNHVGLFDSMEENVLYSRADRPCSACLPGKQTQTPRAAVALVKRAVKKADRPWRLYTLCEKHADAWEQKLKVGA